ELRAARRLYARLGRGEGGRQRFTLSPSLRLFERELREPFARRLRAHARTFIGQPLCLGFEAPQLAIELLEARALHRSSAFRGAHRTAVRFPPLLPLLQCLLGGLEP